MKDSDILEMMEKEKFEVSKTRAIGIVSQKKGISTIGSAKINF